VAEIKMKMAIDPFKVVGKALVSAKKQRVPRRVVSVDYDEEADILYVKFRHARMVDSESLDDEGLVVASLDERGKIAGLMIMQASKFAEAS